MKLAFKLVALVCLIALVSAFIGYSIAQSSNTFYIQSGVYPGAPSFTVMKEGSLYYAKNQYGLISYSSTNFTTVIMNCLGSDYVKVLVLSGTYQYSTSITLQGYHKELEFQSGAILDYIGSDAAVILGNSRFNTLKFDTIKTTGGVAQYGIKILGSEFCKVEGNMIGESDTDNCFNFSCIWFDAANALKTNCGNDYFHINILEAGASGNTIYGIALDTQLPSETHSYEGGAFYVNVALRFQDNELKIGSNQSEDSVRFNSFYVDCDAQGNTTSLIDVWDSQNLIVLEGWTAATGSQDVWFHTGATYNTLIYTNSSSGLRITDDGTSNSHFP